MAHERERQLLIALYEGFRWREKVKKMSDAQVAAIYIRMRASGKL